ncbi:protein of unassigned function [Methylobacterium oryzae CBMB20]|uniref:Protein of unassigned function n=1 Tax=Methylobacterium oryzae CBMB20 TaxID=693986 RepID=A0A089NTY1_9HYPH|nr:protein of unassigned function [Methylobacterium oryzae CBMB20]
MIISESCRSRSRNVVCFGLNVVNLKQFPPTKDDLVFFYFHVLLLWIRDSHQKVQFSCGATFHFCAKTPSQRRKFHSPNQKRRRLYEGYCTDRRSAHTSNIVRYTNNSYKLFYRKFS